MRSNKPIQNIVIVIPTYNEKENIIRILNAISKQRYYLPHISLKVLVVDDNSPDKTASIVQEYQKSNRNIYLITGEKNGLGSAYIRGFKYALYKLNADIIFEMDADLSHNPALIPQFIEKIATTNADFIIGSRYIEGGSIPSNWSLFRKLNSKIGNTLAKSISRLKNIEDCTSGYRAIHRELLEKIDLNELGSKGYAFQINLLYQALKHNANILELPIHFKDRTFGQSKLGIQDILEFIKIVIILKLDEIGEKILIILSICTIIAIIILIGLFVLQHKGIPNVNKVVTLILSIIAIILSTQSIFNLYTMLFAWENPDNLEKTQPPMKLIEPKLSFTAILPARHEKEVIRDTIIAISNIDYPENLKEILIVVRMDDIETIKEVQKTISELSKRQYPNYCF